MNNKIPTTIYLMPGMAASSKIFELIKFPTYYNVIYLKWIKPNKNEGMNKLHYPYNSSTADVMTEDEMVKLIEDKD